MEHKSLRHQLTKCSSNVAAGRLGRTGRAGKMGKGVLVLSPFEAPFLDAGRSAAWSRAFHVPVLGARRNRWGSYRLYKRRREGQEGNDGD